ncbi:3206_t:CDS:2 [Cetraspora pellucida]|uniref:3206_t:CDS:1 n=1 Tax=Cetraspora pellucida TaxID=1433469 RepID=A0ACA9KRI6_9GLOM|nr:3206_t:CDS:2 [Cetraspora pellucida]
MGHKGGKPQHPLSEYFCILPNEWANKSNKKCICQVCMEAVGKDVALNDESMKLTNTRRYCANHIRECSFFATKYLPEQIEAILTLAVPPKKHANSPANSSSTSTSIPKKKQTKIENLEVKALFQFISPLLKLPDRKSLSNRILTSVVNELQESIMELASKDKIGVTIAFDGWCNIVKQEIMGIVFITSLGKVLIWRADNISRERQRQEEVISRIHALFAEAKELNIKANCLVTDSAGAYAAARHYLRNEIYISNILIILKGIRMGKTLDAKDDLVFDNDLQLPDDIKTIINRDTFWDSLMTLRDLLYPFCIALNLMQRNKACLYHNEKVIAMSQLRAEILRTRKPKESKFNYNQSNLSSSSDFLSASSNQSQTFESNNEETDSGINLEEDNSINSETDWDFVVNEWEELLSDEQLDEKSDKESDDEIDNELDFYDSEIHLAENQSAKWKLEDLFLSNLPPLVSEL